ncbi:Asp-tRNA(Asn)/Glu-tRNA(Gln) amidotransferase subunit GatA, partial [candidate division WWE3 bacterium]|nr:Asp-tRNA(Asn)/Glu-tRNA(Gln) amidotransferase subunit GatA [candidate division WWE3 bacterium]
MTKLNSLTIHEALRGLKEGNFSSEEITNSCLMALKSKDPEIKAFVTVDEERAIESARRSDKIISEKGFEAFDAFPLLGIPYAIKDNFCTEGILTTASSNVIRNFVPPYESTVSKRLKDSGAILLGKTNMDAFAHGSSTESSDFFTTRNPWDTSRLPGGSSGGSAAAVASDMCIFSLGSETAGSIRQPACWCGVVGLKPTYGRVSRYGIIAMASSTDSPGPITKCVWDASFILEVIAGKDVFDATTSDVPVAKYSNIEKNAQKLRVGVATSYFVDGMQEAVKRSVIKAIDLLRKDGFVVEDVKMLDPKYSIAVYTIIQRSEVSSNLARFDGIRFGYERDRFGFEAKKRIMLGTYTLSAGYYDKYYS